VCVTRITVTAVSTRTSTDADTVGIARTSGASVDLSTFTLQASTSITSRALTLGRTRASEDTFSVHVTRIECGVVAQVDGSAETSSSGEFVASTTVASSSTGASRDAKTVEILGARAGYLT